MKIVKKLLAVTLLLLLLLSFTSCENEGTKNSRTKQSTEETSDSFSGENGKSAASSVTSIVEKADSGLISYSQFAANTSFQYATGLESEKKPEKSGLFPFSYNGKFGYADAEGNVVLENIYKSAEPFYEGKAFVRLEDKSWCVIDTSGKILYKLPEKTDAYGNYFLNGRALFLSEYGDGYNVGLLNDKMEWQEKFVQIDKFIYNWSTCRINTPEFAGFGVLHSASRSDDYYQSDATFTIYSLDGTAVWNYNYGKIRDTEKNITSNSYNSSFEKNFCTSDSAFMTVDMSSLIYLRDNNLNVMDENGKWGIYNIKTRKMVVECKYDYTGAFSDGVIPICNFGKWGSIDEKGQVLVSPSFTYIGTFNNGRAFAQKKSELGFIDKTGKFISAINIDESGNNSRYDISEPDSNTGLYVLQTYGMKKFTHSYIVSPNIKKGDPVLLTVTSEKDLLYYSDRFILAKESGGNKLYEIKA